MRSEDLVVMGYISGAFGVRGWVKIHADTEYADSLFDYPVWWLGKDGSWSAYTFEEGAVQPKALVAKLEGVSGRDAAHALRGCEIAVARAELPAAGEGEYYWTDLIGLEVFNPAGERLGKVKNLMQTGANDVLVLDDHGKERLLPFVEQVVLEVDLAGGRLTADWGLDY
ncbi:ribosome maturation factor RimM [Crenobacter intestini]|uniref:Ribosome maturation factor RimM n=1 Tax=Crenobacter intestini TaxID=2563443 RepID=A0A4T0USY3_9NEIS|nr:ribosome maturation factor RimM [Crenobacter intestini]TIC82080.1 ribosome maturation factor RimM [Crenobacter intestini]